MGAPKIIWESDKIETPLHEKKKVEALKERLNKLIESDPVIQRKAALILEEWLNKTNR
jgi:hypothetical protein